MALDVTVIIPTYHDWSRLQLCLNALANQSYSSSFFEILVINNDPSNLSPENFLEPENCKIIHEIKPGSYAARNKGLSMARGKFIAFTDSDCIPDKDWLKNGVKYLYDNSDLMRVGGCIKVFPAVPNKPNIFEAFDMVFAFPQKGYVEDLGWAATANMFVRKEVFDIVGFFNDTIKSGGDFEWGNRASEKGIVIKYAEDAIISHPARKDFKSQYEKVKRTSKGKAILNIQKHEIKKESYLKKIYVVFRFRNYQNSNIRKKLKEYNLSLLYFIPVWITFNLIVGFGDFNYYYNIFKEKRQLNE